MNRAKIILFLIFYLLSNVGFFANLHYCGNDIADISVIGIFGENSCACGEGMIEGGCCSEQQITYKVDTDHLYKYESPAIHNPITFDVLITNPVNAIQVLATTPDLLFWLRPKPKDQIDYRHLSCIFLI